MEFEALAQPGASVDLVTFNHMVMMSNTVEGGAARKALELFQLRPDALDVLMPVIDHPECHLYTKFMVLTMLKTYIQEKWIVLPDENKAAIYSMTLAVIEKVLQIPGAFQVISMADQALVEILKCEWPGIWPSMMTDFVEQSKASPVVCKNNLTILNYLAQEIGNYVDSGIPAGRAQVMNDFFSENFGPILEMIQFLLANPVDEEMLHLVLSSLKSFILIVDARYFIETPLFPILCENYITRSEFTTEVVDLLGELALSPEMPPEFAEHIPLVFKSVVTALYPILSDVSNFGEIESSLVIFSEALIAFMKRFAKVVEGLEQGALAATTLGWLIEITAAGDEDAMKVCMPYWKIVLRRLISELKVGNKSSLPLFGEVVERLRFILVGRMVCPYDIVDKEDEDGTIHQVVEVQADREDLSASMKECLGFLCALDSGKTVEAVTGSTRDFCAFSWSAAAIGKFAGDKFVFDMLGLLTGMISGENSEEVVKQIMWFASQQIPFFQRNPDSLPPLLQIIMTYIASPVPIIQLLTVHAFKGIMTNCAEQIASIGIIPAIMESLPGMMGSLVGQSCEDVFVGIACPIKSMPDEQQFHLAGQLTSLIDAQWATISASAGENPVEAAPTLIFLIRCYGKVISALGPVAYARMNEIVQTFIGVYNMYANCPVSPDNMQAVMICRNVRIAIVLAVEMFLKSFAVLDPSHAATITMCVENFCVTYGESNPLLRPPCILRLFGLICSKYTEIIMPRVGQIFLCLFPPTMAIFSDFDTFSEFKIPLINFISVMFSNCITFIASFNPDQMTELLNAIRWICMHHQAQICQGGINLFANLLYYVRVGTPPEFSVPFTVERGIPLAIEVLKLMTDGQHSFAFSEEANLLEELLQLPALIENIPSLVSALVTVFPAVAPDVFGGFITSLVQAIQEDHFAYRSLLRDFIRTIRGISRNDPNLTIEERMREKSIEEYQMQQDIFAV